MGQSSLLAGTSKTHIRKLTKQDQSSATVRLVGGVLYYYVAITALVFPCSASTYTTGHTLGLPLRFLSRRRRLPSLAVFATRSALQALAVPRPIALLSLLRPRPAFRAVSLISCPPATCNGDADTPCCSRWRTTRRVRRPRVVPGLAPNRDQE